MSNKFTKYLKQAASGAVDAATNPKGLVGNWTHATRIFVDDTYRLSPRTKFLFYVQFEIDPGALKSGTFTANHSNEVGMLVRSSTMPKFSFDAITKSQYNRKKILYKTLKYDPVNISLHDDSGSLVNSLWALYYGYYIADRHQDPLSAYRATRYGNIDISSRYGLDNDISVPFFKSVNIYTMSRQRFNGYQLVNPVITNWNHGELDYFEGDTVSSQMTLEYESVIYTSGDVAYNNPKGFASLHYDTLPSPLTVQGGGVGNLFGEGGVLDGAAGVFGDIASGAAFENPASMLGTAISAMNTYKNIGKLSSDSIKAEGWKLLGSQTKSVLAPLAIGAGFAAIGAVGGVVGSVFPKSESGGTDAVSKVTPSAVTSLNAAEARSNSINPSATAGLNAAEANLGPSNSRQSRASKDAAAKARLAAVEKRANAAPIVADSQLDNDSQYTSYSTYSSTG